MENKTHKTKKNTPKHWRSEPEKKKRYIIRKLSTNDILLEMQDESDSEMKKDCAEVTKTYKNTILAI